jgi:hypothetical protein
VEFESPDPAAASALGFLAHEAVVTEHEPYRLVELEPSPSRRSVVAVAGRATRVP